MVRPQADGAAEALGGSGPDLMVTKRRGEAEAVLLGRCDFALSAEALRRFGSMIDSSPKDNPRLRLLLVTKAPWADERSAIQCHPPNFPAACRRASTRFNRRVKSEFNNGVCGMPVRYRGISQTSYSAVIQPSGSKRRRSTGRE